MDHLVKYFHPNPILQLKRRNLRKENRRVEVVVGDMEEKSDECREDILPVGGKCKEAADLTIGGLK